MVFFGSILVLWIISLCLHEYGHARVAYAGGDDSVVEKGYLTLNPLRYMDPLTSVIIPVIILLIGGIPLPGGAVWIDRSRLRSPQWMSAVSAAGPLANLGLMVVAAIPFWFGIHEMEGFDRQMLVPLLACFAWLMAIAFVINMLPLPGLDGFGIIEPFLPPEVQRFARDFARYTFFLLIAVLIFGGPIRGLILFEIPGRMCLASGIPLNELQRGLETFWESSPFGR